MGQHTLKLAYLVASLYDTVKKSSRHKKVR